MSYDEHNMIGRLHYNHEQRRRRYGLLVLGLMVGIAAVVIGAIGLYGATRAQPASVEPKVDEALCRERLDTWLYGHEWVPLRGTQQWQHFRKQMGECVK
jgi:hypothetical protein